jgi:transmembrane sensor
VRLGAATSVQVQFQRGRRNVGLPRGEALFKVAHDKSRPFIVHTPLAAVTAVGTAFNLDVQTDQVVLYVNEGKVDVDLGPAAADPRYRRTRAPLRVVAGDRLKMYMREGRLVAVQEAMAPPPAWQSGRLEYRDEPLSTILEDVNRYAPRPIILADPGIGQLKFTGTVRLDATEAWAFGLPAAFPVTVNARPDGLLLQKKRMPRTAGAARIS